MNDKRQTKKPRHVSKRMWQTSTTHQEEMMRNMNRHHTQKQQTLKSRNMGEIGAMAKQGAVICVCLLYRYKYHICEFGTCVLVGFYQLDTNQDIPWKKESQLIKSFHNITLLASLLNIFQINDLCIRTQSAGDSATSQAGGPKCCLRKQAEDAMQMSRTGNTHPAQPFLQLLLSRFLL